MGDFCRGLSANYAWKTFPVFSVIGFRWNSIKFDDNEIQTILCAAVHFCSAAVTHRDTRALWRFGERVSFLEVWLGSLVISDYFLACGIAYNNVLLPKTTSMF